MDSEDSHDGGGDAQSTSSSSSSSSSSSAKSKSSKKAPISPPRSPPSPDSNCPRSPSPESRSNYSGPASPVKGPRSPDNLSEAHSDINSPENSMPSSPNRPKSPEGLNSPSDVGSNIASPEHQDQPSYPASPGEGPKTPQSPSSSARSAPASPDAHSAPLSPETRSQPASPEASANPDRNLRPSSPPSEQDYNKSMTRDTWAPQESWRRKNKAEQKMVSPQRSRSNSSQSSSDSAYHKRTNNKDPATEEISDGEMESDQEEKQSQTKHTSSDKVDNKTESRLCHEELSDVSDLDSMGQDDQEKEPKPKSPVSSSERKDIKVNGNNTASTNSSPKQDTGKFEPSKLEKVPPEKTSNTEDGEEQLDFEAEEGECVDTLPKDASDEVDTKQDKGSLKVDRGRASSPEEGEVSDEAERRPEELEPRPVCRFYSRGVCRWGVSCRFLHPGVTDKGNYNMFELVRGVPPHSAAAFIPPALREQMSQPQESAWERGLRTAKEMLRIANKRKEQDIDFEEKKLHLSVGGVVHDPDAELAYVAATVGASPPRHDPHLREIDPVRPFMGGYRGAPRMEREWYYEREYRHERPPPMYDEPPPMDDPAYHKRRGRTREVIVRSAESERERERGGERERGDRGERERGDRGERERGGGRRPEEWADPWMRGDTHRTRKTRSSDDYSSSSSSHSSSHSSRSMAAKRKRRVSSSSRQRLSPTDIVRERRLATARATAMNPPAPRRRAVSPAAQRGGVANPPAPHRPTRHKDDDPYKRRKGSRSRKRYSSTSGSESSSSSSESESESRSSSSTGSSSDAARRGRQARLLNAANRPRINSKSATGLAAAITVTSSKKEAEVGKKRSASSPVNAGPAKKQVSRREELLKQLKAVEDAIARKRSKN